MKYHPPCLRECFVAGFFALTVWASTSSGDAIKASGSHPPAPTTYDSGDKFIADKVVEDAFLFREREWSLDVFGMYAVEARPGAYDDGFGPGLGVNYFFNRYVGLGLEGYGWDGDGFIGSVSGDLIFRYPIEQWHLAPYLIGGVGGNFGAKEGEDQVNGSGGIGVEYRFNEHWGVFTDGRYVATEKTNDYGAVRLGVRFAF